DLVLTPLRLRGEKTSSLIDLLAGSRANLFFFQLVEEGCWWLPGLRFGKNCFGSSALRPAEFVLALQKLIEEIKAGVPRVLETVRMLPAVGRLAPGSRASVPLAIRSAARGQARQRAASF